MHSAAVGCGLNMILSLFLQSCLARCAKQDWRKREGGCEVAFTQGSSVLATLSFVAQSLWDWVSKRNGLRFNNLRSEWQDVYHVQAATALWLSTGNQASIAQSHSGVVASL